MMLSAIGRTAIQRLGARVSYTAPKLQRVILTTNASIASTRDQFLQSRNRGYATAATEAKAKTKAKKPAATKATATKKTTATKKPAKKATKAAAKKPAKKAAKKVAKKPVKKPVKKVLTDKQKATKERAVQLARLKELKTTALLDEEPKEGRHSNAYRILQAEHFAAAGSSFGLVNGVDLKTGRQNFVALTRQLIEKFKSLSPSELEHYNHLANQKNADYEASYQAWVKSHTPEEIRKANLARKLLRRNTTQTKNRPQLIQDERLVGIPRSPYMLFSRDRWASGDFKNLSMPEATKLIVEEYTKLSPSEKKTYDEQAAADRKRYEQEYLSVYGHEPTPPTAATAA